MDTQPTKGHYLEILLRTSQTVFTTKDAALLWGESREGRVSDRLHKYTRAGKLVGIRRGIYAKDAGYDRFELANRVYTPSYISFETVLTQEGVNFQYYDTIFVASYLNRDIEVDGQKISYVRMKDYVLSNTAGVDHVAGYAKAIPERAFLDRLYVSKDYHFDNLDALDWDKVFELVPIYFNQRLAKQVQQYFKNYKKSLQKFKPETLFLLKLALSHEK